MMAVINPALRLVKNLPAGFLGLITDIDIFPAEGLKEGIEAAQGQVFPAIEELLYFAE